MNQEQYLQNWVERNAARQDQQIVLGGASLLVPKEVFCPDPTLTYSTAQLLKHMPVVKNKRVLDLGTGSGVLAISAALSGAPEVLAVDIDPAAVLNARKNCQRAGVERIVTVIEGALFDQVKGKFDIILANLPILPAAWTEKKISVAGTFARFFADFENYLNVGGVALFCFASFGDQAALDQALLTCHSRWNIQRETKFGVEWQVYETAPLV